MRSLSSWGLGILLAVGLAAPAMAFNSPALRGSLSVYQGDGQLPAEEYGLWAVYSTTAGLRMKSHWEAIPIPVAADGSFELPEIKFGQKKFKHFYPAQPMSGIIGAMRDRKVPEARALRLILVPRSDLRPENAQAATNLFYYKSYNFNFPPVALAVRGWVDVQMEDCTDAEIPCGMKALASVVSDLRAQSFQLQMEAADDRVQRLFEALEPRLPQTDICFVGQGSKICVANWSSEKEFYALTSPLDEVLHIWGGVDFRVDRERVQLLDPQPKYLSEYEEVIFREDQPNESIAYYRKDATAFCWSLSFKRDVHVQDLAAPIQLPLTTSYGFETADARSF